MRIELLYLNNCQGLEKTESMLRETVKRFGLNEQIKLIDVNDIKPDEVSNFSGSPTVLIDGVDIEFKSSKVPLFVQRYYEDNKPYPPQYLIEAALLRAIKPKKILFMCVHNSARSILAEAIARHLAPADIEILSAGSNPSGVKKEAISVLKELSVPTDGLYSKSVNDIDTKGVNAVITLCAEEVCPVFIGKVIRIHWGLSDPSSVVDKNERIEAFRRTRDELLKRLTFIFKG